MSSKLFLLLGLSITLAVCNDSVNLGGPKMIPAKRGDTRSWINTLQSGFIEGSLKYSSHGKLDCTQEGMKISRAFFNLVMYRILPEEEPDQDIKKNAFLIFGEVFRRCNYITSVEGAIVSYLVRQGINAQIGTGWGQWFGYAIIAIEMLVNVIDDFIGL